MASLIACKRATYYYDTQISAEGSFVVTPPLLEKTYIFTATQQESPSDILQCELLQDLRLS